MFISQCQCTQRMHFATASIITISTIRNCTAEAIFALRFSNDECEHVQIKSECAADYLDQRQHFRIHTEHFALEIQKCAVQLSLRRQIWRWVASHSCSRLKEAALLLLRLSIHVHAPCLYTQGVVSHGAVCVTELARKKVTIPRDPFRRECW